MGILRSNKRNHWDEPLRNEENTSLNTAQTSSQLPRLIFDFAIQSTGKFDTEDFIVRNSAHANGGPRSRVCAR